MIFKIENIEPVLNSFDKKEWSSFFDNIFAFNRIPLELSINYTYATDYLFDLYCFIENCNKFDLANNFKNNLVQYYFELPCVNENTKKIYSLHWLFANIKLKTNIDGFYHQFFSEDLIALNIEKLNLQTSLLSLLETLPNIDEFSLYPYLMNNLESINDLTFIRVALRYLIYNESSESYINYLEGIIRNKKTDKINEVIVESFMDFRKWSGSFQKLYTFLENKWYYWCDINPKLSNEIALRLTEKYLVEGKKWYDNDNYAKFLKPLINGNNFPMPAAYANELFEISQNETPSKKEVLLKSLVFLISNKNNWKHKISIDYDESYEINLISVEDFDAIIEKHFIDIYGIEKNNSIITTGNTPFANFITEFCDDEYLEFKQDYNDNANQ